MLVQSWLCTNRLVKKLALHEQVPGPTQGQWRVGSKRKASMRSCDPRPTLVVQPNHPATQHNSANNSTQRPSHSSALQRQLIRTHTRSAHAAAKPSVVCVSSGPASPHMVQDSVGWKSAGGEGCCSVMAGVLSTGRWHDIAFVCLQLVSAAAQPATGADDSDAESAQYSSATHSNKGHKKRTSPHL